MKKFLFLTLIAGALVSTNAYAQPAGDPPTVLQQMKDKQVPGLVEKVGLTQAQAEKVIEINYDMRMQASKLKDLSAEERSVKIAELKAAKEKKISELLTAEQITAMNTYYEEMAKSMQKPKQ